MNRSGAIPPRPLAGEVRGLRGHGSKPSPLPSAGEGSGVRGTHGGFTLVELLTVIVIIGILVSLITAAAWRARVTARNAVIIAEISDIGTALEAYAAEVGELPPDFTDQQRVLTHLRKRFPRYQLPAGGEWAKFKLDVSDGTDGLDVDDLDPTTALVFWLGGIPKEVCTDVNNNTWVWENTPSGFNANVTNPFASRGSRTKSYIEFEPRRLPDRTGLWRQYHPPYCTGAPPYESGVPYVYFRARIDGYAGLRWPLVEGAVGTAVPYQDANGVWREPDTFQIIAAGSDGNFGTGIGPRCSQSGANCSPADYDNITNFSQGTLQDEM